MILIIVQEVELDVFMDITLNRIKGFSSMLILDRIGLVRVFKHMVLGYSLNLSPNTLAPRKDVR